MLPTEYQQFIHLSRYARYLEEENRRETWDETVDRLGNYWQGKFPEENLGEITEAVRNLNVMPSMRSLMTAGEALDRDNVAGYNCAYAPIDSPRWFDEGMYILMCGTGIGFSVERQFINKLPTVAEEFNDTNTTIHVADSKMGWAAAYRELISLLYSGRIPSWDVSKVRPRGSRLKTFGGRASGAEPLEELFRFTIAIFKEAAGRKLRSVECHDLACKIGEVVVVGGVRRSALISLSNLTDDRMRGAKSGQWWELNPQRALANNSVAYTEKPDMAAFMKEWQSLYLSYSGERGIFNRTAAKRLLPERRDPEWEFGTNPCSEIVLRPNQFCNLTEIVVRPEDTLKDLKHKAKLAAELGTYQSTLTNFRYLRSVWKSNTEEERLLGVSMTGVYDHPILSRDDDMSHEWEEEIKKAAVAANIALADKLGIPRSAAVTCIKPSGTVSQLVDSASGLHPRYAKYYIRSVRQDNKDPLTKFMIEQGIPHEPCFQKPDTTTVFYFPHKSPEGSKTRYDVNAIEQLEKWLEMQLHFCEHKPSITVYVKEHEWMAVGAWVYENFDYMSGVSFLPWDNGSYKQAPYQECTEQEYNEALEAFPKGVDWTQLKEEEDNTTSSQEMACVGNSCELPSL